MSARAKAKWGIIFLMYEVYNQKSIYTSSRMIVLTLCIKKHNNNNKISSESQYSRFCQIE